jgi:hypothetical protein
VKSQWRCVLEAGPLRTEESFEISLVGCIDGGELFRDEGGGIARLNHPSQNPCTRLEVEGPEGTFRTTNIRQHGSGAAGSISEVRLTYAEGKSTLERRDANRKIPAPPERVPNF